jgi:hypothetical protein
MFLPVLCDPLPLAIFYVLYLFTLLKAVLSFVKVDVGFQSRPQGLL